MKIVIDPKSGRYSLILEDKKILETTNKELNDQVINLETTCDELLKLKSELQRLTKFLEYDAKGEHTDVGCIIGEIEKVLQNNKERFETLESEKEGYERALREYWKSHGTFESNDSSVLEETPPLRRIRRERQPLSAEKRQPIPAEKPKISAADTESQPTRKRPSENTHAYACDELTKLKSELQRLSKFLKHDAKGEHIARSENQKRASVKELRAFFSKSWQHTFSIQFGYADSPYKCRRNDFLS